MNNRLQITNVQQGNGLATTKTYSNLGFLQTTEVKNGTTPVWEMGYNFNATTGNLTNRSDNKRGLVEYFTYDDLDRLENISQYNPITQTDDLILNTTYFSSGNIYNKSDVGTYNYDVQPHAVSEIRNPSTNIPVLQQDITYTAFKKAENISENNLHLHFTYGPDYERKISELTNTTDNSLVRKVIYVGNYEEVTTASGTYKVHYIAGGDGLAAMYVIPPSGGGGALYYVHTDHLGSIVGIYDASGNFVYAQNFDAWGRERSATDWSSPNPNTVPEWLIRGYTGHEHHREFGLINMNGRIYDPVVGRMLSPDNFVQSSEFTQTFNRYSYGHNNPLVYTDPDGDNPLLIIGALIGGYSGYQIGRAHGATGWEMAGYIFGGAAIGAVSGGVGSAVTSAVGASATVAYGGLIATGVGGATAGAISGAGFAALGGGNVGEGLWKGAVSGLAGGLVGGYVTGGAGAFLGGATSGAVGSALNGGDLNEIGMSALIGGGISFGSYQLQSAINYSEYKESGGTFTRKQFNAISRSAQKSFTRGREYGGWLTADGGVEMFPRGQQAQMQPQAEPQGATGFFHTHPNTGGNWVEIHSPADINFNNNVAGVPSLVVGRQNAYMQLPGQNANLFSTNKIFNPYPFNYYWFR